MLPHLNIALDIPCLLLSLFLIQQLFWIIHPVDCKVGVGDSNVKDAGEYTVPKKCIPL